ncbi:hypothetical protein KV112_04030 [Mycolicibacter sp. MYC123]|uniref:WYL domain-containing protein n=1 Tax=[Mycobacterium] zoologicum TaxID=2872311 RepID=A0ABU5YFT8_9MYCO|nr:hypothetical protein [Mycolicibacter sp. MYC123]MEB3048916.1 hypothetical protein [Mycolicibacter sp. MYC123]
MGHNQQAYLPEIRQLLILGLLKHAGRNGMRPSHLRDRLWYYDCYPGRNDGALHRRFSEDMKALRGAGLIAYNNLHESSTVKLAVPQKDRSMFLRISEHNALFNARQRMGWRSVPSPMLVDSGAPKLDLVVRAVRLMEEGTVDVSAIADMLNVRPTKVRELMNRLDGVRPESELLTELVKIERDDAGARPTAGHVRLGEDDAPLEGRGLDEIGLFAYSRAEIDDRLALIDAALNHADTPEVDIRPLRKAREKLQRWSQKLG